MADQMQPTPRSTILGLFSDIVNLPLQYMSSPERTQQMQGTAQFLYETGIPKTLERLSYGDSLFSGAGMTLRPREETINAAMNVAPFVKPAAVMANRAAMSAGRAGERLAERVVPQVMERSGLPAQLLSDVSRGSVSPVVQLGSDFLGKKPPTPEQLARVSDKFLYHSSTADKANDLLYGIEPQAGGNWVREVAQGSVEGNLDDFFENVTPLSWFSDNPSWIKAMVGRKLDKPFDKVTVDDIEKHGHLAIINKKSPSAQDIYFLPEQGLNEGSQSIVYDIQGNPKKAWQTDLYQEGNYGQRMEPFGTEKNEYVSAQTVEPFIQLTGKELVDFMKAKGLIEDDKIVPSSPAFTDPFGNTIGSSIR
jgi:hypothetical protein